LTDITCNNILPLIRADFGSLWQCRSRGNSIEVVTPFSTSTQKFVSVFITHKNDEYIVSDGGWLSSEFYLDDDALSKSVTDNIIRFFTDVFKASVVNHESGKDFYFKKCSSIEMVSSSVYDIASFVSSVVNAASTHIPEKKELDHQTSFRKDVNDYLGMHFGEGAKIQEGLDGLRNVKYNAIIEFRAYLSVVMYVTGSSPYYFDNAIRKAAVNFELTNRSKLKNVVKSKVAVINDKAEGFSAERDKELLEYLEEKSTSSPVFWSDKEKILERVG
jgi:hypothetical protein